MDKYVIRITRLGAPPILGIVEHSEEHAKKMCAKNKGWEMVMVEDGRDGGGKEE
jgi:hypothetical protein